MMHRPTSRPIDPSASGELWGSPPARLSEVEIVNPLLVPNWDKQLLGHKEVTVFHSQGWARTLASTYGHIPVYASAGAPNQLNALLPMVEARSWLTGNKGVSLPFTDLCQPLGDHSFSNALIHRLIALGRERHWKYVEFRGIPASSLGGKPSLSFVGHTLELNPSEDQLFAGLESSVRRAVRKAESSGLSVAYGSTLADVETYYALHCRTRQRHGLPPQPFRFFENLHQHVLAPGQGAVILARKDNQPVAGAVFLHFGGQACYKFGASDDRFQQFRGSNLVIWHGILYSRRQGCSHLDFGRTTSGNEGLRRFKLGYGTTERTIDYLRLDLKTMTITPAVDRTEGRLTQLYTKVPQTLSRWIGRLLYPHAT